MTDQPNDPQEKKIIVDEDWKSKVEAEREELRKKQEAGAAKPATAETPKASAQPETPLPPASLSGLVTSLAMQAMMAMGLIADPSEGKPPEVHMEQARHYIDLIEMLQTKSEGNRTPQENALIENLLHELRIGFVSLQSSR